MNCTGIDSALAGQQSLQPGKLSAEMREHGRTCPTCRALLEMLSAPSAGSELRPELARGIEERLERNLTSVRPLRPARYYAAGFAMIFLMPMAAAMMMMKSPAFAPMLAAMGMMRPAGSAPMSLPTMAIVYSALAVCGGLLAISLAAQMAPGSRGPAPPAALNSGILLGLAVVLWALFPYQPETTFWMSGARCLMMGIAVAVPATAMAWGLLRRGAVLSHSVSGATAGLLGGLAGTVVLEIYCPDPTWNVAHILMAHWGAALACAAAGWLTGAIMDKLQSKADQLFRTAQPTAG